MTSPFTAIIREARNVQRAKPLVQYQRDPLGFFVRVLGIPERTIRWSLNPGYEAHRWDGERDPLVAIAEGLANGEDVGVESGTGTGKSFEAACLTYWYIAAFENARVYSFATKEDQLRKFMWREMRELLPRFQAQFPTVEMTDLTLRVRGGQDDTWGAFGVSVGVKAGETVAAGAKGMHAERMLLIYEETQGIPTPVIETGFNTVTGRHNHRLFIGNPDHQLDGLHVACTTPGVRHIRISALDHPNVVTGEDIVPGGAVSRQSVERRRAKYGETGRLYTSQVRGISPAESSEALIKLEWVQRSNARWLEKQQDGTLRKWGKPALGVDVANSEDGDDAAIAQGWGHVLASVEAFKCPDANRLGWRVAKLMETDSVAAEHVGVDTVGVGAGTFNELARLKKHVRSVNGGFAPIYEFESEEEYRNIRAQSHWWMREDLRLDRVDLPPDDDLARDLITPQWGTKNGKIVVQPKEEIKANLPVGRSPNKGDAVIYWNFVRDRSPLVESIPEGPRVVHGDPTFVQPWMPEAHDRNTLGDDGDTDTRDWVSGRVPNGF